MPALRPFGLPAELTELQDDYELQSELGRGGTAVVYRARDGALGRDVAVKVVYPRPTSPDDDPVARLAREARLVAQLQHPNIVAVYAVRRLRGGGLALIMQLVAGGTLKTAVQTGGPLAPDRVESVLRDVASALAYAHARGLVHRDVKPENIFLDESTGRALLADFGIARSADAESMTMTGTAVGTPFYMSPEQVDGGPIDGRSDLYSLGLAAWEALTGRRPWDGESLYNVIYKQKFEELPPIEAIRPDVPRRLQYLIERMLQKRPGARWAGAEGLLAQLQHAVLPADYARWQRAVPARIERFRAAEAERAAARTTASAEAPLSTASTLHFVPGAARDASRGTVIAPTPVDGGTLRPWGPGPTVGPMPGATTHAAAAGRDALLPEPGATVDLQPSPPSDVVANAANASGGAAYPDVVEPTWGDAGHSGHDPSRRRHAVITAAVIGIVMAGGLFSFGGASGVLTGVHASGLAGAPNALGLSSAASVAVPAAPNARPADDGAPGRLLATSARVADGNAPPTPLAAGGRHTCALTLGGRAHCWGANDRGQLGDGGPATRRTVPVAVAGALRLDALAAGLAHTCAVTRVGDVYCWGSNARGQLGDATTVRRNAPVRVAGPVAYTALAAGSAHTCAITTDGGVRCWGANDRGQVGDGPRTATVVPTAVRLPGRVTRLATGGQHTCAGTDTGQLFCWGGNADGQLGTGTLGGSTATPTAVALSAPVVAIGLGAAHSCAVTGDGAVWCWGRNDAGQLGDGTRARHTAPVRVALGTGRTAVDVTSGAAHTCALLRDGAMVCWGRNARGAVGDGTGVNRALPVAVRAAGPVIAVATGTAHTCAITTVATTLCWGDNLDGQLGDSSAVPRSVPAAVHYPPGIRVRPSPTALTQR